MRDLFVSTFLLAAALAAPAAAQTEHGFAMKQPGARPRVIVPGGYTSAAPAHTARPIEMAIEDGLDCVELEVRRTKDDQHVIFSAPRVDGFTSGQGELTALTLAELQALDAGSWFAPRFSGAKVLTLPETFALTRGQVRLHLVCIDISPERFARELAGSGMASDVVVSGPAEALQELRNVSPDVTVLTGADAKQTLPAGDGERGPAAKLLFAAEVDRDTCDRIHAKNQAVVVDACGINDNVAMWDRLIDAGCDYVRTALPAEFLVHAISRRVGKRPLQIAAHRGQLRYAPENTVAALAKAHALQADFVEIDVRTTKDGAWFLVHDATVDRTTNGKGPVRENSAATLRSLDAGSWFGAPFRGAQVPELDEYLAQFPSAIGLYFDAKDITPTALVAAVEKHGLVERTVVYQGPVYLEKVKQLNPRIRLLAPIANRRHVDTLAARLQPYAVDAPWRLVSRELIEQCHALNIKVFSDAKGETTVDEYAQAIEWGIDLIQTDHPLKLWHAIDRTVPAAK